MFFIKQQSFKVQMFAVVFLLLLVVAMVVMYDLMFLAKADDVLVEDLEKKLTGIADLMGTQISSRVNQELAGNPKADQTEVFKEVFEHLATPLANSQRGVRLCLFVVDSNKIFIKGYLHEWSRELTRDEQIKREGRIRNEAAAGINAVVTGGIPITRVGRTWDDRFLECLVPIRVGGKVAAVVWAEERMHPIFAQSARARLIIRYVTMGVFVFGIVATLLASLGLMRRVERIKDGILTLEKDFSCKIPEMPGEMGEITRAINKMAQGLTEKEQLEDRLRATEDIATLGRLVTDIAHELRNPVSIIQAATELAATNIKDAPWLEEYVSVIEEQIERHNKLIGELLEFGRSSQGTVDHLNLNELVEGVIKTIEPLMQKNNVTYVVQTEPGIPLIQGNREKLKQVFINLTQNAIQAMPGGGNLYIETYCRDSKVFVLIRDTGEGISREDLPRIFQPFYTRKAGGSGLGLAISKEIVQIHRGSIEVESEPKKGTTFTVSFPSG